MSEKKVMLKVRNLTKEFKIRGKKLGEKPQILHALTDVSVDIYEGETLGVIGESGCGKSTFGKCLVQLHKATAGTVEYEGKNIFDLKNEELKKLKSDIQMVFQDPFSSLDPRMTAGKLVEEPMIVHKIIADKKARSQKALELLQTVGLDVQHVHRYPHEFSGGQRQRINIARALSLTPKLIVCDEPVSALDVSIQAQVLNLFNRLQEEYHLTYVFISHDLSVIKHISDRIAIMYLGRIVELCDADSIYENPLHPYTKALLSAIPQESPFEKKERIVLTGEIPSPIGDQIGCPLAKRCPNCTERCMKDIPKLKEVSKGHQVACFLYENN
ncbi:ABC transporter ATP-binding protein [Blautia hydrogenotrophica]|uniref:ABC transporter ATP-binding protein n=1 Tax=Blautia hydrogenotrophica TaxID=53443 RepID=UPI0006C5FE8F|nr:oligopeptide/dipeptide ABC transporter ATP-binding protein [Blautia hydrogenotrophica]MEE0461371.1 oligopeptide/dipeptide ABC transporter ATP-binding protein [Blautia hydrogenotrophica]CUN04364.1 Glutathione import ATP-binding protein GsiA [Blautia hydrogenotrophica]SCI00395.1 Glutathione import ATP-binding protein GsiA [uncultured Blautia sp.]